MRSAWAPGPRDVVSRQASHVYHAELRSAGFACTWDGSGTGAGLGTTRALLAIGACVPERGRHRRRMGSQPTCAGIRQVPQWRIRVPRVPVDGLRMLVAVVLGTS